MKILLVLLALSTAQGASLDSGVTCYLDVRGNVDPDEFVGDPASCRIQQNGSSTDSAYTEVSSLAQYGNVEIRNDFFLGEGGSVAGSGQASFEDTIFLSGITGLVTIRIEQQGDLSGPDGGVSGGASVNGADTGFESGTVLVLMDASSPLTISAFVSMGFYFDFDAQNIPGGGEPRIGFTGFTITDEAGDLITGATYRTESGSQYNFANAAYAAVPEPATLSLAAFAIGGLAALKVLRINRRALPARATRASGL